MNLVIEGPAMNFRSQFKRLLPRKRSPEMKKSHSISVESYDISLPRSPNRKTHDLSIAEYPIDKVKNSKPIKLKAQLRKWLESKRLLERVSEHKRCDASCSCQTTIGTEYAQPDPSCGIKPDSDRPPDYAGHSMITDHVFMELKRSYAAIECIDLIAHSQSSQHDICGEPSPQFIDNCPHSIVLHVELPQSPTNRDECTELGLVAHALEDNFHNFYYNLKPFIHLRSDSVAQIPDPNIADLWGNLFSDIAPSAGVTNAGNMTPAHDGAGVSVCNTAGITTSKSNQQTTAEGCSGTGSNKLSRVASVLDQRLFLVPMLAELGTWEIDLLHKNASPKSTPDMERSEAVRGTILKFDQDFQSSDDTAPNLEWQRLKFDDIIRGEGEPPILAFDSSTNIKKHTDNSTESGRSYAAIQSSQGSGSMDQKLLPKRGRSEGDSNEGKKRKKKDQSSQTPSRPSFMEETFACPFKDSDHPAVSKVKACSTDFPNLSKVKEHLRRAHYPHLQCPQEKCNFCAGSTYEINRHQGKKHLQPPRPAIEQSINLEHLQKHRALKLRTLTWERISRICFSMEYTQEVLGEIPGENDESNEDEIEDERDDEVPSPASGSESQETNGNTPATDFGNEHVLEKYAPGPLAEDIIDDLSLDVYNAWLTSASAIPAGTGEGLQIPPDNAPNELHENFLPEMVLYKIYNHFENMRWKLTPLIIYYLRTHHFLDETGINREIETIFEGLYQLVKNLGIGDTSAASDPQTNFPSGPDGVPRFTLPPSPTQQSSHTNPSPWNNYGLSPSPAQTYMGLHVSTDLGTCTDTPMYCEQENKTTAQKHSQPPDPTNELLAMLSPRFPTGEYPLTLNPYIIKEHTYVADVI